MKDKGFELNSEIIKACDIRGVYGSELTLEGAYHLGRGFGTILVSEGLETCAAGYDGRHSSPELAYHFMEGLRECGIDILLAGLVPTPVIYNLVMTYPADAGVIITASHNPPEYNGCKFILHKGLFHGKQIIELAGICLSGAYREIQGKMGSVIPVDWQDSYINFLLSHVSRTDIPDLRIVWDPGNGASAAFLPALIDTLPGKHTVICGEVDGNFPNHHPDPCRPENMQMLSQHVQRESADLGIAFDGDGDRIGVVDDRGRFVTGDQLLTIFARSYLEDNPGAAVMSEVKASSSFYQDVEAHGGVPVMWKVGHAYQKEKMREENIGLAGETSGHIFFRENFGLDDGMFAAVKLAEILGKTGDAISAIIDGMPNIYSSGEIRLDMDEIERKRLIADMTVRLGNSGREIITIDGIRVPCDSGYWIVRGSNTQPQITIYCEAASETGYRRCIEDMIGQFASSGFSISPTYFSPEH